MPATYTRILTAKTNPAVASIARDRSARGQWMRTYIPDVIWGRSWIMDRLFNAMGQEYDTLRAAAQDVLNQFFVQTATWGLDQWENFVGLQVSPPGTPDVDRRESVLARLRGYGTATVRVLEDIAASYARGAIAVAEDFANYTVYIRFVDTAGHPANLQDVERALRAVLPAHLSPVYQLTYTTWDRWDLLNLAWDQQDALGLTFDESDTYV